MISCSKHIPLETRFWLKVEVGEESECWNWTGKLNFYGYGELRGPYGRHTKAHRLSLEWKLGRPLGNLHALHKCDNPACVNPNHLFEGTHTDNVRDMYAKGRDCKNKPVKGELNGNSKLSEKQVRIIKRCLQINVPHKALASIFYVSTPSIAGISSRKNWKHVILGHETSLHNVVEGLERTN